LLGHKSSEKVVRDRAYYRLSQNGITFVGKALLEKHLDRLSGHTAASKRKKR